MTPLRFLRISKKTDCCLRIMYLNPLQRLSLRSNYYNLLVGIVSVTNEVLFNFFSILVCNLSFFLVTFMFLCDTSMLALRCCLICLFICAIVWERKRTGLRASVCSAARVSGYTVCRYAFVCVNVSLCVHTGISIFVYFGTKRHLHRQVNTVHIFSSYLSRNFFI